ncbi:SDR family NAD(P)-dependent oxidoreductase [Paenibacillus dokdonensis]|uniref:SDR family NAD(P)-dependent oxidoreductase n=1 Tax=Paenibacillus dokdonensis TaxID=2567944 RepID=A0ABU6GN66_9BACL|nr:SDR family NAD(P)-dependent oxidoreductase [Paenibacillus dokdonensis]
MGEATEGQFLPLAVDLTQAGSIQSSVKKTYEQFGQIDVAVNNAGYGIGGAVEELSQKEIMSNFEVNVFGPIHVIQSVLPYMRKQRSGHIFNISSIAGFAPHIGWSVYAATKFSLMGLTEVLAQDVQSLGIKVTAVAPGGFRTEFNKATSLVLSVNKIEDYSELHAGHKHFVATDGKQLGDPEKAAEVFIDLAESPNPPAQLFLGSDAYRRASEKLDQLREELEANKNISFRTDFE